MEDTINSLQNPAVKQLARLQQKSQERTKQGLFVIEGTREVSLALQAGVKLEQVFLCNELLRQDPQYPVHLNKTAARIRNVSVEVYNKMAYRKNVEGIIGLARQYKTQLDDIRFKQPPLILVLESIEKPGNLGAVLRTADACAADAVVVCNPQTDVFNPNVIRSSLGSIFTNQLTTCKSEEFIQWAKKHEIKIMIASLQVSKYYFKADMNAPVAIAFGTEAEGLSQIWYNSADEKLKIPMLGKTDSLNVSASLAVIAFEVVRQRMQ